MLDNMNNCDNITKIVKIILCDCNLYDWYINIIYKNPHFKRFIEQYKVQSNDILKDYLIYCFKNRYGYMVHKHKINASYEPIFGNIFMLDKDRVYKADIKLKQRSLHEHKLREHLHNLIYLTFIESRKKTNIEVIL